MAQVVRIKYGKFSNRVEYVHRVSELSPTGMKTLRTIKKVITKIRDDYYVYDITKKVNDLLVLIDKELQHNNQGLEGIE